MNKKEVLELKKRFKKDECTFTKMTGCYVDGEKNIVLNINKTFLNLEEEEYFKYLEIAKKTLSGTIDNNLLELDFPMEEENQGGRQHLLMELKRSKLKNDELLDDFYRLVIDSYDYTGNFLILLFHDAYDVMTKTTDNMKLDESEEIYEYILCAICPVTLSKAALGYFEEDNRIGARIRDWVVGAPDLGFVFPAFTDRSTDIHSVMYYTKNAKEPHPEFMEAGLGCVSKQTATEQKEVFSNIIRNAIGAEDIKSDKIFMEIQESLNNKLEEHQVFNDVNTEPMVLTNDTIQDILIESGVPEELSLEIEKSYTAEFGDNPPVVDHLIDSKVIAANAQRKKEQHLEAQVERLQHKLKETEEISKMNSEVINAPEPEAVYATDSNILDEIHSDDIINSDDTVVETPTPSNYDIVLRVKPQKVSQIKSQIIDGKKYIVIPVDEDEQANVNGVETIL